MRFLHTGDLHLDSAFCSAGAIAAEAERERQRRLLKRIFALAEGEDCDMLLMSGDVFDSVYVTPETASLFCRLCADFKRPVVIAPGNHDPYVEGGFYKNGGLPDNVFVFSSPELQYFDFAELGVTVAGYAFTSSALTLSPLCVEARPRETAEGTLLLCAHCDLGAAVSKYAPVTEEDIAKHGFDYAALGHAHNPSDMGERVRYCGFAEGRGFDETGDGGVWVADLGKDGEISVTRHRVSEIRYVISELSVDGAADMEELIAKVRAEAERYDKGTYLRLRLFGVTAMDGEMDRAALARAADATAFVEIEDVTIALPDGAALEKDLTLRGEFFRTLRPRLVSDSAEERKRAVRALRIGLAAIDGKRITDGGRL